jgi:hypothetical protein
MSLLFFGDGRLIELSEDSMYYLYFRMLYLLRSHSIDSDDINHIKRKPKLGDREQPRRIYNCARSYFTNYIALS